MPIQRAVTAYRVERLNCAQSILRAFQPQMDLPEEAIRQAKRLGKGQAEGGRCGALHAALHLAGGEAARQKIAEAFVAQAEAQACKDIRQKRRMTCAQCVELAASLLTQHLANAPSESKCP